MTPTPAPPAGPAPTAPRANDDGPLAMIERFFGNPTLRRVGMALSLGILLVIPMGAIVAARMKPTRPAATEPPPFIQQPKDPGARDAYNRELQALQTEAQALKARGVPSDQIIRQMDPRMRDLNRRFQGR